MFGLGQPHHLTMEYEKVNTKAMWQKRLAWMAAGYVGGSLLSQLIGGAGSLIAAVVTLAGYPGAISGVVAVVVMAACWIGLLGFLICNERVERELPNPMTLTTAIVTALVLGFAMNWMGILIQQRTVSLNQMGEYYLWQTYGMIPLNICVLVACTSVVIKYGRSRKAAIANEDQGANRFSSLGVLVDAVYSLALLG